MVGEAKFLRALFYFDLTNMYGDAPLILDKPDVNTQSFLPRDPKAKIIAQVIQDLKDAFLHCQQLLPKQEEPINGPQKHY